MLGERKIEICEGGFIGQVREAGRRNHETNLKREGKRSRNAYW